MENNVIHKPEEGIFVIKHESKESFLRYTLNNNVMNFLTTYVDPSLRGKGYAAILVEEGLKYARENNFRIIPTCSYVEIYLNRNNSYNDLVSN